MTETTIGTNRGVALRLAGVRRAFGELVVINNTTLEVAGGSTRNKAQIPCRTRAHAGTPALFSTPA